MLLIRVRSAGYVADSSTNDEDLFVAPADAKLNVSSIASRSLMLIAS